MKDISITLKIEVLDQKFEVTALENYQSRETQIILKKDNYKLLGWEMKLKGENSASVFVQLPERTLSVAGQYNDENKYVIIHPNKTVPEEKIELRLVESQDSNGRKHQLSLHYPDSHREKSIVGSLQWRKDAIEGHVSLDISPTKGNVLQFKITGTRLENNVFRLLTSVVSNVSEYCL